MTKANMDYENGTKSNRFSNITDLETSPLMKDTENPGLLIGKEEKGVEAPPLVEIMRRLADSLRREEDEIIAASGEIGTNLINAPIFPVRMSLSDNLARFERTLYTVEAGVGSVETIDAVQLKKELVEVSRKLREYEALVEKLIYHIDREGGQVSADEIPGEFGVPPLIVYGGRIFGPSSIVAKIRIPQKKDRVKALRVLDRSGGYARYSEGDVFGLIDLKQLRKLRWRRIRFDRVE